MHHTAFPLLLNPGEPIRRLVFASTVDSITFDRWGHERRSRLDRACLGYFCPVNRETANVGLSLLEQGEGFAWVTILETRGSSPRHSGAAMVVRADGSITGTIGGGPLEGRAIQHALKTIETGLSSIERFDSARLGMMCGGGGYILVEYVDPGCGKTRELFRGLAALLERGGKGWMVTVLPGDSVELSEDAERAKDARPSGQGGAFVRRCLVCSDGRLYGEPVCDEKTLRGLAERGGTYDRIVAAGTARTYVQLVGAQGTVYIFGAGHCGAKLEPLLSALGFFTVVIDDRPDFANRERFPTADRIIVADSFDGVVDTLPIDDDSYLVIVTRSHSHDQSVLAQALKTRARYIGMIGSRKKVAETFRALGEQGFSAGDLARVHAPIGLSIGAETPEEIAVSIAAELIQMRSGAGG